MSDPGAGDRVLYRTTNGYHLSCVLLSKKKNGPLPAKDLYDSEWFRKARAYVESVGNLWFILSAKYGLLDPDTLVESYNETLDRMSIEKRREWSRRVLVDLGNMLKPRDHVIILAGSKYRELLVNELKSSCASVEIPIEGLRIGEQLSWLARH